jgi:hypothetical protein
MKISVKDPATGKIIAIWTAVTLCGSREDFADLYDTIGRFFGWDGSPVTRWPAGYAEIEIRDLNFETPPQAPDIHRPIYDGQFTAPAVGAEDTPSPAPSGEPRLTPGSETLTDDDIPF